MKPTDVGKFIADLDGGIFEQKLSVILSDVAAAVVDHDKAGKVTITLDMKRFENTHQVVVSHDVAYIKPKQYGKSSENDKKSTPMHVGVGGRITLFPESQVPAGQMHLADKDDPSKLVEGSANQKEEI